MCGICGCGDTSTSHATKEPAHGHPHDRAETPEHVHAAGLSATRMVQVEQDIMSANQRHADANRRYFTEHGVFVVNLVSSPGSGKTSLLVETIRALQDRLPIAVIEGDQQTGLDAARIAATGVPAWQINTGKGCHLDAHGVGHAVEHLPAANGGILFIENVGNLVCPAGFDLGEAHKVVVLSVTEGEDKPFKYPHMFHAADMMLLNKIDLLPFLDFDVEATMEAARQVHPSIEILAVSAMTGNGIDLWLDWLLAGVERAQQGRQAFLLARRDALQREIDSIDSQFGPR